jgi:pyruvate kinase
MQTRTKIICTIGPAVGAYEKILQLMDAGMNVARLNFSHGTHHDHLKSIEWLKRAREERKVPLAIMLDTKGPEIRLGMVREHQFPVQAGQHLLLVKEEVLGDASHVQVIPPLVVDSLDVGMKILIDDGYLIAYVVEKHKRGVVIKVENPGFIKSQKGVNIPGVDVALPAMTAQDIEDLTFGCIQDIDIIAASFIRSAHHVLEIKNFLDKQKNSDILVIAKIENSLGVQNFDEILQVADGIMVARGDLGVEMPLKEVPRLQKMMIRKCYLAGKPVITATQMLESMIQSPRPTRAEVSDVANAIYDSTSAVMLSGETAVGQYPIETVKMMKSIIEETEKDFNYRDFFYRDSHTDFHDVSHSVALASVKTAYSTQAKGIFCFTNSGFTARLVSRFRPEMPLVVLTPHRKIYHQMALHWGVIAVDPLRATNVQEAVALTSCFALRQGIVSRGDLVVVTAGAPFGVTGTTNMMLVENIS